MHARGVGEINDDGRKEEYDGNGKYEEFSGEFPKMVRR